MTLREEIRHCRPFIIFVAVSFVLSSFVLVNSIPTPPGEMLATERQTRVMKHLEAGAREAGVPIDQWIAIHQGFNEGIRRYGP